MVFDEKVVKEKAVRVEERFPVEFKGEMTRGIQLLWLISVSQLALSGIMVWWSRAEVIFPDRVAPKYIFDIIEVAVITPFAIYWH